MASELSSFVNEVIGHEQEEQKEYDLMFVAPMGAAVPTDDIFTYTTVNDLRDLAGLAVGSVVLFTEEQAGLVRLLCSQPEAFGLDVRVLHGAPGLEYLGWWNDASFGVPRQMYGALVSELRVAQEVAAISAANNRSGTDVERERYSRADGSVRHASIKAGADVADGDDGELE